MKTTIIRSMLMATMLTAGLSLTSCKDKTTEEGNMTTEADTLNGGGAVESPMDTIVEDNDTIIDTGGASDSKVNPAGTQVP